MLGQIIAWLMLIILLIVMISIAVFMGLFGVYHTYPELWQAIKDHAKKKQIHKHRLGPWEWFGNVPSVHGGLTGFAVALCMDDGCDCAAIMPRTNLMEIASPESREEFLEGLKKIGRKLIE